MNTILLGLCLLLQNPLTGKTKGTSLDLEGVGPSLRALLDWYETEETRSRKEFTWKLRKKGEREKYIRYDLTFDSPLPGPQTENNKVYGKYWRPKDGQPLHPAVILLHWMGGSFQALDLMAARLSERGICSLMIYLPHYGPRRAKDRKERTTMISSDNEGTLRNFRQAVLDIRRARDWLADRPEVEGHRVSLMGVSLGAIVGSLAAGIEPRFDRNVFLLGGGDLPSIALADSKETEEIREKIKELGATKEDLRIAWKKIEPLTYASRIRSDTTLMINADEDRIIPKSCTLQLQESIGVKNIRWVKGGHYALILKPGHAVKWVSEHVLKRTWY